ncbi:ribosome assembly RNA-binding protein YhbY [Candidatus Nitrotoga sp. M5]|uniref:ribosome assembly RNA-binding protein YhbY n=1 Tax=Candidatus Nitrotoga sp. M5 TaxID=2890409 RepID=UPI001EF4F838|nr:ribosome assembly RNA-binding protein YhbY [Candidatus Nitrotoga sp. M5]CAH1387405.1 ribosome assembly factor YhbY [Candidatus Nitrotoga sp. M5]
MLTLSVLQRQNLKARAHPLKPTVMIGSAGLTTTVLREISCALKSHELIKIRVMSEDREAREATLEKICTQLNAAAVQHIGKILVVYQPQEDTPVKKPTQQKGKTLSKKQLSSR